MTDFDPNGVGIKGTLFGLSYDEDNADIIVLPIPWDVTVSYGSGTADGPEAILGASSQIDYEIPGVETPWKTKVAMLDIPEVWHSLGVQLRIKAESYIDWRESGSLEEFKEEMCEKLDQINKVGSTDDICQARVNLLEIER